MNILVVDDEPLIHHSIEFTLKKLEEPDCALFHAANGHEMLRILQETPIHMALVDIQMPGLSGLECIRQARELSPQTLYYIMSGFSEFDYARSAIRLGVQDYLLKPLDRKTLHAVCQEARSAMESYQQGLRDGMRLWITEAFKGQAISHHLPSGFCYALVFITYDSHPDKNYWFPDFCRQYHEQIVSVPVSGGVMLLLFDHSRDALRQMLDAVSGDSIVPDATIFLSGIHEEEKSLGLALRQAGTESISRIIRGTGVCYQLDSISQISRDLFPFCQLCLRWKEDFFRGDYPPYLASSRKVAELLCRIPDSYQKNALRFLAMVSGTSLPFPQKHQQLEKTLLAALTAPEQAQNTEDKIHSILDYINSHFQEEICIADLAEHFSLSPNYLSTILKKELGTTFVNYLTGLRIAYACQLLVQTNLPIREITEKVGYYSQSHFSKVFQSIEGCTPARYRQEKQNDSQDSEGI